MPRRAHPLGELLQLQDCGGTLGIQARQHHAAPGPLLQVQGQFAGRGGLTCTLQTREQDHDRGLVAQLKAGGAGTQHAGQFIVDDLDEGLARTQAAGHLSAHGPFAHPLDKAAYHGQRDVGFQQRPAHVAQRLGDVVLGETPAPAHLVGNGLQAITEVVEHSGGLRRFPVTGARSIADSNSRRQAGQAKNSSRRWQSFLDSPTSAARRCSVSSCKGANPRWMTT